MPKRTPPADNASEFRPEYDASAEDMLAAQPGARSSLEEKVTRLVQRGVNIINPSMIYIDDDVNLDKISGSEVTIYPGCRIHGSKTVISAGVTLGYEAPVVLENCQLGPKVDLRGGYFKESVFLEKANMGLGAQVREACILEEEAGGAHCVGLKQTILFPFVTLGSLINFCDCLMAGGTSRKDHSEVGSSYIHFNFTPDADKTTASLIGDVPRGVMLNQPPIFLGGQGGMVGPLTLGYGNVVAAGTILRQDVNTENRLIFGKELRSNTAPFTPKLYSNLQRIVQNNIRYLANLLALEQWYIHVRQSFFDLEEFGSELYEGAREKLTMAKKERGKRLLTLAEKLSESVQKYAEGDPESVALKIQLQEKVVQVLEVLNGPLAQQFGEWPRDRFSEMLIQVMAESEDKYLAVIQALPAEATQIGTQWLQEIVDGVMKKVWEMLPAFNNV